VAGPSSSTVATIFHFLTVVFQPLLFCSTVALLFYAGGLEPLCQLVTFRRSYHGPKRGMTQGRGTDRSRRE
jgi:hypothetical protein